MVTRLLPLLLFALVVLVGVPALAADKEEPITLDNPRKLKRIPTVVKKRVEKKGKLEIAPSFTYVGNDPWVRGYIPGGVISFHLSGSRALELYAGYGIYWNKPLVNKVVRQIDLPPRRISRPRTFLLLNWVWSPFYGKMSFFGETVIHHDFFIAFGGGLAAAEVQQNKIVGPSVEPSFTTFLAPTLDVAIGQHFFLGRRFSLRLDLRPVLFLEPHDETPEGDYTDLPFAPNLDLHFTLSFSTLIF